MWSGEAGSGGRADGFENGSVAVDRLVFGRRSSDDQTVDCMNCVDQGWNYGIHCIHLRPCKKLIIGLSFIKRPSTRIIEHAYQILLVILQGLYTFTFLL